MGTPSKPKQTYLTVNELRSKAFPGSKPSTDPRLRFIVHSIMAMKGVGTLVMGEVLSGILKTDETLTFYPKKVTVKVTEIQMSGEQLKKAKPGDMVGLLCGNLDVALVQEGNIGLLEATPPHVGNRILAQIIVLKAPDGISKGHLSQLRVNALKMNATISDLVEKINPKTGQIETSNPPKLEVGNVAVVQIELSEMVVLETYAAFPALGIIALRDNFDGMDLTIASGIILEIQTK